MFAAPGRSRVIAVVLFLGCVVLLVVAASARKLALFSSSPQAIQPRVTNKTSSVRISNVRLSNNGLVEVTLSNQSTKAIYAYTMITSQNAIEKGMTTLATDAPMAPGETKVERIPAGNLKSAMAANSDDQGEIALSAVYFEGGTVEGDARHSEKLKALMGGMKEQAKLALQILHGARASREQDLGRLLDATESQAASMPLKDESVAVSSKEREMGKVNVNSRLLKEIKNLKIRKASPNFDVKGQLAELISYYERLAEKL